MDADTPTSFGSLLKGLRLARRLSQEDLAARAGLSREAISLLERGGRRAPRRETIALLAKALTLSPAARARLLAAAPRQRERAPTSTSSPPWSPTPLPPRLTSFIGREREISEVLERLLATRLLTLSGPGGIGKTSMALVVAAEVRSHFGDGVALVDLAALADGDLVPFAVAAVLGVREQHGEPILTTLCHVLGMSARLLVLDNCEHLLLSCAQVVEALLRACSRLRIVVTSREPLGVGGEVVWRVPGLTLPDHDDATLADLRKSEAVRLFVDRAEAIRSDFVLTQGNVAAVVEICRRLDGIPLAIELAAVRVAALTPEQIACHLTDRFRLLTSGSRTALPRYRTLRATLDWSYDLLASAERSLVNRLAVFAGGFALEAVKAVCPDPCLIPPLEVGAGRIPDTEGAGAPLAPRSSISASCRVRPEEVLDLLVGLVDKSLVIAEERDGETRYRLLETLKEYAREKLDESGETPAARAAHAAYFANWIGRPGPQPVESLLVRTAPLGSVADEVDNLRAALGCFLDRGQAEAGLSLAARISPLWLLRGPREEGRAWLRRILALPTPAPAPSRPAALYAAGWLAKLQGDLGEAQAAFAEAAALAGARGDRPGRAHAQAQLGAVAFLRRMPARARAELKEGARLAREAGAPEALLECLVELGYLALAQGDVAKAQQALTEGQAVLPSFPVRAFRCYWLAGDLALAEGRVERATQEYRAALAVRWVDRDPVAVAVSALGLAEAAALARAGARAARLLGASEGLALGVGSRAIPEPVRWAQHARVEAAARELLGDDAFADLRAEGRRLDLDEVARLAQTDV